MSIESFIEAANVLYDNEYYNEALCLVCIAVDACAGFEFPEEKKNGLRYKKYLTKHFRTICHYGIPGIDATNIKIHVTRKTEELKPDQNSYVDLEQILYHVIRCGLVHNAKLNPQLVFSESTVIKDWDGLFFVPAAIIKGLEAAVEETIQ